MQATVIGGATATTSVAIWATSFRETLHANVQVFVDIGAYIAPFWLLIQIGCLLHVTFFKNMHDDKHDD
jgi:hypothetical protein